MKQKITILTILTIIGLIFLAQPQSFAQQPQYPTGPFPWNGEPSGVSFSDLSIYTPDKEYNLSGDWYHSDNEEGWVTLEKAFSSSEGGSYDSWVLATFTGSGLELFINDTEGSNAKKYVYSGSKLSELTLSGYYEWKIGGGGYNDWVSTEPPYPIAENLNLGESMTGHDYIQSYIPEADFSFIASTSNDPFASEAKELNLNLEFQNGLWVPKE
jgi:hypothetical protein